MPHAAVHSGRRLVVTLVCLGLGSAANAAALYVSGSGNDAGDGSRRGPLRTIQHAVELAGPGDAIYVSAGRYVENVSVENSGEPGKWLTISAAPGDERQVVVGTEQPRIDASGSGASAFALRAVKWVRLRGFKCVAAYRSRASGIHASRCEHIEILDCIVTGGGSGGVDVNRCGHILIDGVEAYFNGGGPAWSSGISVFEPTGTDIVVRNCICYGNYDRSAHRSDGNGIIIDNGYDRGGALLVNNLCFMNGGKGICSTRTDNCIFLHNSSVANCWQLNQQATAHELSVRGAHNVVRNNIGIGTLPEAVGMQVLPSYSGPMGNVAIDPKTVVCDHNLFFNPLSPVCVVLAGGGRQRLTLDALREAMPHWAADTLSVDPGFVDMQNLDFRLRPDSPALRAGVALPEVPTDLLGRPRPRSGACSLGCYEGGYTGPAQQRPKPGVAIAPGADARAINALLANRYDLDWHGMLWGWGKLLTEELPLQVDVQGPRKADFRHVSGSHVLGDLLEEIARDHQVRLVLRQPDECRGLPTTPHVISRRLTVHEGADAEERSSVRRALRTRVWTADPNGNTTFAELLPALSAAVGMTIRSTPAVPPTQKFAMTTMNMQLSAFLTDLADRMELRFTLSRHDPLADATRAQVVQEGAPFGGRDGIAEAIVERPRGSGRLDMYARVSDAGTLCGRVGDDNARLISPPSLDSTEAGDMYVKGATRLAAGDIVRLAVSGSGAALCVARQWVILGRMPRHLNTGRFYVRTRDTTLSQIRFAAL